jgi:hypothetical protein
MVSYLGSQRLLKLRFKWTQAVQNKLVAGIGILHMMLVFRSAECKKCGVIEASIKISKEYPGGKAIYRRARISTSSH